MLRIDVHEPSEVYMILNNVFPTMMAAINEKGYADYLWDKVDGSQRQVERKQWGEVLAGMDKIEDQLRRHKDNHPNVELNLLIEGTMYPEAKGCVVYREAQRGILVQSRHSPITLHSIYAWLNQVSNYVQVFFTPNTYGTAIALSAFYQNDQKEAGEHRTFQRHYKSITFSPNPQVTMLMGLLPGIAEKRAIALISKFAVVWNVLTASPEQLAEVPGIGLHTAKDILRKIGRPDIKD